MSVHVPTLLEGILEATAAEAAAKARITTLRAALEDEARRRFAADGAAPSWNAPQLGKVRLDPASEWSATVADPLEFGSYVAQHHPTEATVVVELKATDAADTLKALEFIGVEPIGSRVEVRPAWSSSYLKSLAVDVTEERDESAQVHRTVIAADTATGNVVPGIGVTRSEAKLVVSLDRDRRTAAVQEASSAATALVEASSEEDEDRDARAELAALDVRRRELEGLHADQLATMAEAHSLGRSGTKAALAERIARAEAATGLVVRPASTIAAIAAEDELAAVGVALARHAMAGGGFTTPELEVERATADLGRPPTMADVTSLLGLTATPDPLPEGTEVEEVTTLPAHAPEPLDPEEAAELEALAIEVDNAPGIVLDQPVEEVPDGGDVLDHITAGLDRPGEDDLKLIAHADVIGAIEGIGSREVLRKLAKGLNISAAGTKTEVAQRLAYAGHTATTLKELLA